VKVYIQSSDFLRQFKDSEQSEPTDRTCVRHVSPQEIELRMENNELYKIYSFNGGCYDHLVEPGDFVNKLVEPIREIATVDHKDICFI
jgi:hypothetical protein